MTPIRSSITATIAKALAQDNKPDMVGSFITCDDTAGQGRIDT